MRYQLRSYSNVKKNTKLISDEVVGEYSKKCDVNDNSQQLLDKTFVCSVKDCGKEFRYKFAYNKHYRRRHSAKTQTLRCEHSGCDYVAVDKDYLKSHLVSHSDDRPFTCNINDCGKTFKRKCALNVHQLTHRSGLFQCTREGCQQTFKDKEYLKRHFTDIHSSKPFICRTCGKGFDDMKKSIQHRREVHQKYEKPIVCPVHNCNKEFSIRFYYKQHVRKCHSGQVFLCNYRGCDYVTKNAKLNKSHAMIHLKSRPFVCGIDGCAKAYKSKDHMNKHQKSHYSERFACTEFGCRKTYKFNNYLDRHIDSVHSEKPCKYKNCKYTFTSKDKYKIHLRRSHGVGPLSCTQTDCDYTTDVKRNLRRHLKKHSNERPFVCDHSDCGKAFKEKVYLEIHKRTHYDILRICHYEGCQMTFNDKNKLNEHIDEIHLHITRKYSCEWPECNYTTNLSSTYHYHRGVHLGKHYKCTHANCEKSYSTRYKLNMHMRRHETIDQ